MLHTMIQPAAGYISNHALKSTAADDSVMVQLNPTAHVLCIIPAPHASTRGSTPPRHRATTATVRNPAASLFSIFFPIALPRRPPRWSPPSSPPTPPPRRQGARRGRIEPTKSIRVAGARQFLVNQYIQCSLPWRHYFLMS